jgi:hypothetical protein
VYELKSSYFPELYIRLCWLAVKVGEDLPVTLKLKTARLVAIGRILVRRRTGAGLDD